MALKLKKDFLSRGLVNNFKLVPYIDKAIGAEEFEWKADFSPKTGDDAWHPSSHCTPSAVHLYDIATGQAPISEPSIGLRKSFIVGHFWHAYIQHIVVERLGFADSSHIERKGERRWADKPFHWASGAGDIAPCDIPGVGEVLIDIKTMRANDFAMNSLPQWCAAKYECQINIYLDFFDLESAIILCVMKDSPHDFKEFFFKRNQPLIDAIYRKWMLVGDCIDQGIEPPENYVIDLPISGTSN